MQESNPYAAPTAVVEDVLPALRLGGRGERLAAAIIDGLILLFVLVPLMFAGGYFSGIMQGQQPGFGTQLLWSLLSFALFIAIQGFPLAKTGQTWGKKLLKLKIVDLAGAKPDFVRLVGMRYGSTQLISLVPIIGGIYVLVDVLFIFRDDRRCIHDLIAGTRVVVAD